MTDTAASMEKHVKIVGGLMLAWGALVGVVLLVVLGVTGVGAATDAPDFMQGMMGFFSVLLGALTVLALGGAYGLFKHEPWSRSVTIGVAVLSLFTFPVGTAFGAYALWVVTRPGAKQLLSA